MSVFSDNNTLTPKYLCTLMCLTFRKAAELSINTNTDAVVHFMPHIRALEVIVWEAGYRNAANDAPATPDKHYFIRLDTSTTENELIELIDDLTDIKNEKMKGTFYHES